MSEKEDKKKRREWHLPEDRPEVGGIRIIPQIGVKPSKLDSTKWMDKAFKEIEENFDPDALKVVDEGE